MKRVKIYAFSLPPRQHDIVRKVAKKCKVSKSAVIRSRITTFEDMVKELTENLAHSDYIDFDRL